MGVLFTDGVCRPSSEKLIDSARQMPSSDIGSRASGKRRKRD